MGTAESQRGRGVGAVLLRRGLRDQQDAGPTESESAWIAPYRFYARAVGARLDRVFRPYRKDPQVPVHPASPLEQRS